MKHPRPAPQPVRHRRREHSVLIVGGPNDGQWHTVDEDLESLRLPIPMIKITDLSPLSRIPKTIDSNMVVAYYKAETLHTPWKTYVFFRHADLTTEAAFDLLFSRYGRAIER